MKALETPSAVVQDAYDFERGLRAAAEEHRLSSLRFERYNSILGAPTAALAAVSGTAILATSSSGWHTAAGVISLIVAALSALVSFFGFSKKADEHRLAGARFANLATEVELFRRQEANEATAEQLASLIKKRNDIRSVAPNISKFAKISANHNKIWKDEMTPTPAEWKKLTGSA